MRLPGPSLRVRTSDEDLAKTIQSAHLGIRDCFRLYRFVQIQSVSETVTSNVSNPISIRSMQRILLTWLR
jgi:hypothetical protein